MKKFTLIIIFIFLAVFVFAFLAQVKKPPNYDIKVPDLSNVAPLENSTTVDTTVTQTSGIKEFTLQDVAQHASPSDCYLSINGGVYDVSSYISYHPGGRRMITSRCGTEVTNIFARIHSNRAWDILASFKIGKLASTSPASTKQATVEYDLNAIEQGLKASNPNAEVVNVKPKNDFYIAKVTYQNKLYEVHISKGGKIIQEEVANDEFNWSLWDTDSDDQ